MKLWAAVWDGDANTGHPKFTLFYTDEEAAQHVQKLYNDFCAERGLESSNIIPPSDGDRHMETFRFDDPREGGSNEWCWIEQIDVPVRGEKS